MNRIITLFILLVLFGSNARADRLKHLKFKQPTHLTLISENTNSAYPNRLNRIRNKKGLINILYDENDQVPDSMKRSLAAAAELWELEIHNQTPINIMFLYDTLPTSEVFEVEITVSDMGQIIYPYSLIKQQVPPKEEDEVDGIIILNSALKWNCSFDNKGVHDGYNLLTQALRGIALIYGFGSSIRPFENSFYWSGEFPTIFDSKLVYNDELLSNIEPLTSKFTEAVTSDNVFLLAQNGERYHMKSRNYTDFNQLVYMEEPSSLMYFNRGEKNIFQSIDNRVSNILYEIGWNRDFPSDITIKSSDLDDNGYGSAALPHTFNYESSTHVSSIKWEYRIRKTDGTFTLLKTGESETFSIPAIQNIEDYFIDTNGNLSGVVSLSGLNNIGEAVSSSYNVSLGLKPMIVSIRNVREIIEDKYSFRLQFDVEYLGADQVYVSIETDGSSKLDERIYNEPVIAHITTNKMSRFFYHWIDVMVINQYGSATDYLEVPENYINDEQYFIQILDPELTYEITPSGKDIWGDITFSVLTNYPGQVNVKVSNPMSRLPWNLIIPHTSHPTYQKIEHKHKVTSGFKFKATIPALNLESDTLFVNDFISTLDKEQISGVENVSAIDEFNFMVENNKLRIFNTHPTETIIVEIADVNGKIIAQYTANPTDLELDLTTIPRGIYIVRAKNNRQQAIKKIIL